MKIDKNIYELENMKEDDLKTYFNKFTKEDLIEFMKNYLGFHSKYKYKKQAVECSTREVFETGRFKRIAGTM